MKRINEHTKVTLTVGQLKRLVKEASKDKGFPIVNKPSGSLITGPGLENVFEPGTIFILDDDGPNGETSRFEFIKWDPDSNRGMWFKPVDKWTKDYYLEQEEGNEVSMYDPETGCFWFDHDGFIDGPFKAKTKDGKIVNYDPEAEWDDDEEDDEEYDYICSICGKAGQLGHLRDWVNLSPGNNPKWLCPTCAAKNPNLAKESRFFDSLTEADENDYIKIPFKRSELMALGFRNLTKSEDHLWSDALPEAVVFCTPFICMICGNDNGNRCLEVSLPIDTSASWLVYDPSNENIKQLMDDSYPEGTIHDGINADFLPL